MRISKGARGTRSGANEKSRLRREEKRREEKRREEKRREEKRREEKRREVERVRSQEKKLTLNWSFLALCVTKS